MPVPQLRWAVTLVVLVHSFHSAPRSAVSALMSACCALCRPPAMRSCNSERPEALIARMVSRMRKISATTSTAPRWARGPVRIDRGLFGIAMTWLQENIMRRHRWAPPLSSRVVVAHGHQHAELAPQQLVGEALVAGSDGMTGRWQQAGVGVGAVAVIQLVAGERVQRRLAVHQQADLDALDAAPQATGGGDRIQLGRWATCRGGGVDLGGSEEAGLAGVVLHAVAEIQPLDA